MADQAACGKLSESYQGPMAEVTLVAPEHATLGQVRKGPRDPF